jgi:hypothetical protein
MTVAAPPIQSAEKLFHSKAKAGELVGTLGRAVATDSVAIDDIDLAGIEIRGAIGGHLSMGKANRAGDVSGRISVARARIDNDDLSLTGFEIDRQIPRVGVKAQLVRH